MYRRPTVVFILLSVNISGGLRYTVLLKANETLTTGTCGFLFHTFVVNDNANSGQHRSALLKIDALWGHVNVEGHGGGEPQFDPQGTAVPRGNKPHLIAP